MKNHSFLSLIMVATLVLTHPLAMAGEGHDHGPATPAASGPAMPRFAAASELFELVGVLSGKQITLYLDRAADNSPVTEAQIELEIGGQKFKATRRGSDEFEVSLPQAPPPGVLPITATVSAGADTDLLAGELDIPADAPTQAPAHVHSWKEYAGWVAGGLAVLAFVLLAGRRAVAARRPRIGSAA
jgi:hypothetical protein